MALRSQKRYGAAGTRTLLITGGAGFIGANFVHYWLSSHADDRIIVLDALTYAGNVSSLAPVERDDRFRFIHGDIGNEELVECILLEESVDTLIHFAAESHVDRSVHCPDAFIRTNVMGTNVLLQAARRVWAKGGGYRDGSLFHHVSTDEVYGSLSAGDPPFTEESPYAPSSPYAASKAGSDHLVRAYYHTYGLPTTTSNCSNNFGPYQFPEKLLPLVIVNALDGKLLPLYGDGLNVRDWLYVKDHCCGIEQIIMHGRLGETYNLGGNAERRNIDAVRLVCDLIDNAFREHPELAERFPLCPASGGRSCSEFIEFVKDRPGHDRRYAIDCRKATAQLGFRPSFSFGDALSLTVSWYLEHEGWWRGVMDGSYRDWISAQYQS